MSPPPSVSRWIARYLLPAITAVLLTVDVIIGINWIAQPVGELTHPVYSVARLVMSMDGWGMGLATWGFVTTAVLFHFRRCRFGGWLLGACGGGGWFAWSIAAALSVYGIDGVGYYHAITMLGLSILHLLAGAAWPASAHVLPLPHRQVLEHHRGTTR